MREILFRGKRIDDGEWVEGFPYIWSEDDVRILLPASCAVDLDIVRADPATVSQYIGHVASHKVKIFEGDVLEDAFGRRYIVEWLDNESCFVLKDADTLDGYHNTIDFLDEGGEWIMLGVVGNIYDDARGIRGQM